jgi:hypothetical protein
MGAELRPDHMEVVEEDFNDYRRFEIVGQVLLAVRMVRAPPPSFLFFSSWLVLPVNCCVEGLCVVF